jgi:4'-phosphopantetheinyl transferase
MRTERERVFAREEYALPPDGVHVWRGRTNWPAAEIDDLKLILSSDEQQRAAKFHFDADRRRFLVGRGMLRVLIGRCLGMPANRLTIACAAAGKPKVAAGKGPTLEFNISHSGEVVLIAIARVRPVGIDVERMRTDIEIDQIASRFFSPKERADLSIVAADAQYEAFFACWTRKEAYIKACGVGLSLPLDQFDVAFLPGQQPRLLATRHDRAEAERWTLRDVDVGPGYKAALVVEGTGWSLKCFDWRCGIG